MRRVAPCALAWIFAWNVHQRISARLTGIGIEDQIQFDAVSVSHNRDVVAFGSAQQIEP
jgi:hypothetical protein